MAAITRIPPFDRRYQLIENIDTGGQTRIPGAPLVSPVQFEVDRFLTEELDPVTLNRLYPYLVVVARRDGGHIDALDGHITRGREIVVTENPDLHLVWYYNSLYLKPIPRCLLNYDFWREYLSRHRQELQYDVGALSDACRCALGFLRSYRRLIRHESDFLIAKEKHLIPEGISFWDFRIFINNFNTISDDAVTPRYRYGQIRLTRLNIAVWLFPPRSLYFHQLDWQVGQYFSRWAPLLLFLWASVNLILSSMQVVHNSRGTQTWAAFSAVSWIFAVAILSFLAAVFGSLIIVMIVIYGAQLLFALKTLKDLRRARDIERTGHDH